MATDLISFRSERFAEHHVFDSFTSGHPVLDSWLHDAARTADASGTARVYVWPDDSAAVRAYYALAPHVVRRAEIPKKVGRGSPDTIPAILIARLALAEDLQGQGLGSELLVDALERCVEAVEIAGGRLVVVDAIDEGASGFYERYGFKRCPGRPERLVMKASAAAAL